MKKHLIVVGLVLSLLLPGMGCSQYYGRDRDREEKEFREKQQEQLDRMERELRRQQEERGPLPEYRK